jgi:alpha-ketoglutarate-dependent taurine dioxygenase
LGPADAARGARRAYRRRGLNRAPTRGDNDEQCERLRRQRRCGANQLLQYLISQASVPEYQVRFRWRTNSVAIWDNRRTQHYAAQDFWPAVRNLERAGIVGDRPY